MTRIVAVDFGEKRIGLATSDASGLLATPRTTLRRKSDASGHRGARARFCRGRGDRARRLRHPPLAGRRREPLRRPDPLLRLPVRPADGPAGAVPRGDADLRRGDAAPAEDGARARSIDRTAAAVLLEDYLQSAGTGRPVSAARRFLRLGLLLALLAVAARRLPLPAARASPGAPGADGRSTIFFPFGTSTSEIFRKLAAEGVVSPAWLAEAYYRVARSATPLQAGEYRFRRPDAALGGHRAHEPRRRRPAHDRRAGGPDRRGDVRALLEPGHQPPGGLSQRLPQPAADRFDRARRAGPRGLPLSRHLRRDALDLGAPDRRVDARELPQALHAGAARPRAGGRA